MKQRQENIQMTKINSTANLVTRAEEVGKETHKDTTRDGI